MARTIRDSQLGSRSARAKLAPRHAPYWLPISPGRAIGWRRKDKAAGVWYARLRTDDGLRYQDVVGVADDILDADGHAIVDFAQAQEKARAWFASKARELAGETAPAEAVPYTVNLVLDDYFAQLESDGRDTRDARGKAKVHIRQALGEKEAGALTADVLREWRTGIANTPRRLRGKPGDKPKFREAATTEDELRRRRATANRLWTTLRAALNHGYHAGKIASDKEWKKVKPFESVDGVRVDYLSIAESTRLINACDSEFRPIVQAGLLTGARYGAIAKLTVADFNPDAGTMRFQSRKGKGKLKTYYCHLTAEGVAFFQAAVAGRNDPNGLIFRKANLDAWGASHQKRRMAEAVKNARIGRTITFHHLRHTWASHAVMNGTPLLVVAGNLGHADTRMVEKHYGHLAPSYRAEEIRKGAPTFGITPDTAVLRE
jgi:integrase